MRLVYMGTPNFAVPPLKALNAAGHEIIAVVTRADKPAGRGMATSAPPVKLAALDMGLKVYQPVRVRQTEFIDTLRSLGPDIIVVAAYGQILPKEVLTLPKFGCINIHASLLPKYRGAAPINWAIIRGEKETGITIIQMDEGMDTGAILMQEALAIGPADTAGILTERLSLLGSRLIVDALRLIETGGLRPVPQDHSKATLAPLLKKEDGLIDWGMSAEEIHNRVRGLSPWPSAYTYLDGRMIKILETEPVPGEGGSGVIVQGDKDLIVGTGTGMIRIKRLQPEAKKPMTAAEFLRGQRGITGKRFVSSKS